MCAQIWAHFKEFVASVRGDLRETHDEMFQGADTPKQRLQRSVKHGLLLLAQLCLIMGVYAAGCALASVLPITLPGNILGMVLLLVLQVLLMPVPSLQVLRQMRTELCLVLPSSLRVRLQS